MNLHKLLIEHRLEIVDRSREKVRQFAGARSKGDQLEAVLNDLYQGLVEVLSDSIERDTPKVGGAPGESMASPATASRPGSLSFQLSYSISQIAHSYSSICQAVIEYANETNAQITAEEFTRLNLCLDIAISNAVTEFEALGAKRAQRAERSERLHIGFLAHEIRNALSNAMMAHELIHTAQVSPSGSTSSILNRSLVKMKDIIDRAMAEVRLGSEPTVDLAPLNLYNLLSELEISGNYEANAKVIALSVDVEPDLEVTADRHLMASALSNIIQNAIKYSPRGSTVRVTAYVLGDSAVIDVEDQCGGLPAGKLEEMFVPYKQGTDDKSGLGLGVSIAQRAVKLNNGNLTVRNVPGSGCIFTVTIPLKVPGPMPAPTDGNS